MTVEAYFAINEHLGPPPLNAVIWRCMPPWKFKDLLERRALWFSRLEILEDEFEGQVPKANLLPPHETVAEAVGGVHLAHAAGVIEAAGAAFQEKVDRERPLNLINCWYLGEEPSEFMWDNYAAEQGSVAIQSHVGQVGAAIHHEGAANCAFAWPITYIEHDQQAVTMRHFLAPFFVKGRCHEPEWEIRFLVHLPEAVEKGVHVAVHLEGLFDRVLVRTAGDPAAVDQVQEVMEAAGINQPAEPSA